MPASTDAPALFTAADLEIRNILLVDDDAALAESLRNLLEAHNFVVTVARNGTEGIKEVMALDFDAVVCDMMMPGMAGDMFFLAVQRTKPALCRRFVFITGHGDEPKVDAFIRSVGGLVLHKPVRIDDLVRMIGLAIKNGQA